VTLDGAEDLGGTFGLRVRMPDGELRETVLDVEELDDGSSFEVLGEATSSVSGDSLFDLVEAQRIEHAVIVATTATRPTGRVRSIRAS